MSKESIELVQREIRSAAESCWETKSERRDEVEAHARNTGLDAAGARDIVYVTDYYGLRG